MKKFLVLIITGITALMIANCGPSKKASATKLPEPPPKLTFANNMTAVIMTNCTPCHVPSKGGNKKPYDIYANVKTDIDEMIRRIELAPGDRGFMPFKHAKLSDSTIAVFKQWKADGMLEQ